MYALIGNRANGFVYLILKQIHLVDLQYYLEKDRNAGKGIQLQINVLKKKRFFKRRIVFPDDYFVNPNIWEERYKYH